MILMPLRRRAEQHAAMTQAEAIARALGDPASIAQVLQLRAASLLDEAGNVYQLAGLLAGAAAYTALMLGSERDAKEYVDRALAFVQELDDPFTWMVFRGNLGLAALLTGDTDAAEDAFRDELRLCRELVILPHASEGLQGLAAVAAVRGDDHRAARLLGAAAEDRRDRADDPVEARLGTEFFEPARTRHGADAWDAAARDGGTLSFDDAIAYALQEPRSTERTSRRP